MKSGLRECLRVTGLLPLWSLFRRDSALRDLGWFRSVATSMPVDKDGRPLPWYTYPAISFLEGLDLSGLSVFEYGMGNSTLWWAGKVSTVIACDHDPRFESRIRAVLPGNARSMGAFQDRQSYVTAFDRCTGNMEVVVVDGNWRNECIEHVLGKLPENGVVLLDNSERAEYEDGRGILLASGFRELCFRGMGPINHYEWSTSVFYRSTNCLGI